MGGGGQLDEKQFLLREKKEKLFFHYFATITTRHTILYIDYTWIVSSLITNYLVECNVQWKFYMSTFPLFQVDIMKHVEVQSDDWQ